MTVKELIEELDKKFLITLPSNEWIDFGLIMQKIEEITGIEAHGKKQVKALESLEKLIWYASMKYHKE